MSRVLLLSALAIVLAAASAAAEPEHSAEPEGAAFEACDANTAMRLSFLEKRLDARQLHNSLWWKTWTGVYVTGMAYESVQAGLEDSRGKRANHIVSAAKSVIGTTRLLWVPPAGRNGAEPLQAMPATDEASCVRRLEAGEAMLRRSAEESRERFTWLPHVGNVALNLAGALIVTQAFDYKKGWTSAGIGVAVGEAMIWSRPWKADEDLRDYEDFVARTAGAEPQASWRFVMDGSSARIEVRY